MQLALQRPEKIRRARRRVRAGRDGGEGDWLLSLELLQWQHEQAKFDERAVEFAVAFEVSPPSWEPPPRAALKARADAAAGVRRGQARASRASPVARKCCVWEGVLAGASSPQLAQLADVAQPQCRRRRSTCRTSSASISFAPARFSTPSAGSRAQRKAVQIVGAIADRPGAAAADRHFAAALRQESGLTACRMRQTMETFHGTTILSVRRDGAVALGGDGQVTLGQRRHQGDARARCAASITTRCSPGFAGRDGRRVHAVRALRGEARQASGTTQRAAVELAKDWRSDRMLRRLEAMLADRRSNALR